MPVRKTQVKNILMPEEPDYSKAAQLGPAALPHLKDFIVSGDEALASKAAYLAGLIEAEDAVDVLISATASQSDLVRIAAASSARYLKPADASKVLVTLSEDESYGVRKMVLKSVPRKPSSKLAAKIKWMARNDPERRLRHQASKVLSRIPTDS